MSLIKFEAKYTRFERTPSGLNITRKSSNEGFPIHWPDFVDFIDYVLRQAAHAEVDEQIDAKIAELKK